MEALALPEPLPRRMEPLVAAAVAGVAAAAVILLAPPGGDEAAHLYRTMLVRDGVHVWDNLWYGGHYPLLSYSPLYYLLAAPLGNVPVVVAALVASSALFASVVLDEWGAVARWPARTFALLAAGPFFMGTYSYIVGVAVALATLRLLQCGRTGLAVGCGALALGFSPLAFAFLCLTVAAVAIGRRRVRLRTLVVAAGLAAAAGLELAALAVFPRDSVYPFGGWSLVGILTLCTLGAALAHRSPRGDLIAAFFALWALACVAAYVVPSPFGDNLTRLRALVFPLVLLTALLARFRPRPLALAAVAFALAYNVAPYALVAPARASDARASERTFWEPALAFLRAHSSPDHRVEVVPTFDHWEAYWVPRAGFALARGWYRQIDLADNPELYAKPLQPRAYREWLRRLGVRYVLLPDVRLAPMGAEREARLLRSGEAGLVRVFASRSWEIFRVPAPQPILSGAAPAGIDRLAHDEIAGWTSRAGVYRLSVRYTPYWRAAVGALCLEPTQRGFTLLRAARGGRFHLKLPQEPTTLLRFAFAHNTTACR